MPFHRQCLSLTGGNAVAAWSYTYDAARRDCTLRLTVACDTVIAYPEVQYTLWNIVFEQSQPAGRTCGERVQPLAFDVMSCRLRLGDGTLRPLGVCSGDVRVVFNGDPPVAIRPSTWSQLKAHWR